MAAVPQEGEGEKTATITAPAERTTRPERATLHAEGFVSRRKRGTSSIYRIADPGVHQICDGSRPGSRLSWRRWRRCCPAEHLGPAGPWLKA